MASYRSYGGGTGSGSNVTLGSFTNDERQFRTEVKLHMRAHNYVATVNVSPEESDGQTDALEHKIDLSDLRPHRLEIARNEDGRIYRRNLLPNVKEYPRPSRFEADGLQLYRWSFSRSEVILNDVDFLGFMGMSSGPLAYIDLAGLAKIEFSLLPFRNAKPIGVLKDGTIKIRHESGDRSRFALARTVELNSDSDYD